MEFGAHEYSSMLLLLPPPKLCKDQRQNERKKRVELMIANAARFTKFLIYSFLGFFLSFRVECVDEYYYEFFFSYCSKQRLLSERLLPETRDPSDK